MRKLQDGPHLEEIGEGWLSLGSDGSGLEIFDGDPVAKLNAPTRKDRVDTAHLARLNGTDFVQWYGRKSDGCFWPIGRIMRLTYAGKQMLYGPMRAKARSLGGHARAAALSPKRRTEIAKAAAQARWGRK